MVPYPTGRKEAGQLVPLALLILNVKHNAIFKTKKLGENTMIKLNIDGKILQDAALFITKSKTRYPLQGVSIKAQNGILEIAGTDGGALYLATRKLGADEQIEGSYILKMPKLKKNPGPCDIASEGQNVFLSCREGRFLCETIDATYPNYWAVIPANADLKQLEHAKEFALFNWEYVRDLEKVIGRKAFKPLGKDYKSPHFWQDVQTLGGLDYLVTVVIMPMRG